MSLPDPVCRLPLFPFPLPYSEPFICFSILEAFAARVSTLSDRPLDLRWFFRCPFLSLKPIFPFWSPFSVYFNNYLFNLHRLSFIRSFDYLAPQLLYRLSFQPDSLWTSNWLGCRHPLAQNLIIRHEHCFSFWQPSASDTLSLIFGNFCFELRDLVNSFCIAPHSFRFGKKKGNKAYRRNIPHGNLRFTDIRIVPGQDCHLWVTQKSLLSFHYASR